MYLLVAVNGEKDCFLQLGIIVFLIGQVADALILGKSGHKHRPGNIPNVGAVSNTIPPTGTFAFVGMADNQRRGVDVLSDGDKLSGTIPHFVPASHVDARWGKALYRVKDT